MKFYTKYIWAHTEKIHDYVNITTDVEQALYECKIKDGMILVSSMHVTSGIFVNDAERGLIADITKWIEGVAPFDENYKHHKTGETNGDAHLKSLVIGHEIIVPVTDGKLDLGTWQQIFYAEFDGQRDKRILLKVMGE